MVFFIGDMSPNTAKFVLGIFVLSVVVGMINAYKDDIVVFISKFFH